MHHAATADFQPLAGLADRVRADVDFGGRLGERKMRGAKTHLHIVDFEERLAHFFDCPFQVAHVRRFVDHQRFDLVEHRRVRLVAIAARGAARCDDADRAGSGEHRAHLNGELCVRNSVRVPSAPGAK